MHDELSALPAIQVGEQGETGPLLEARARFEELVEGLDAIVWEMDVATWAFTYVSRRAEDLLGYPIQDWLGQPGFWSDVILHPDDRAWALDFCANSTRQAQDHAFEYRARAADGSVVWLHDLVRVVRDEAGEARLLRGLMVDVTRQKEAEQGLRAREQHAALAADVGLAVSRAGDLRATLQSCAESIVTHLDAAFARIWVVNEADQVLELEASAGLYTHLDGGHARVPVGAFKIGMIAAERAPHLTNDVPGDPRVGDQDWARREGMTSFAGYPLMVDDRVIGVVAMFGRHAFGSEVLHALRGVAERLALVVEREETGRELRRRERQLAEAQAIAELGSWEWAIGSDTVHWSDELRRIFGVDSAELITFEQYLARLHPEDLSTVQSTVQTAVERGESYQFEHRIVRPDGAVRHIFSRGEVELDRQGRPFRLFGIAQDITQRHEAAARTHELALEQFARGEAEARQAQVRGILESITDAFFAMDRDWRFTYVNRQAEKLLQRPASELLGASLWEEFPESVGSTFDTMYRRSMEDGRTVEFEAFYPPLDAWFDVRAYPSEQGLSVYFRDVTERKLADQALAYQSYITRTVTDNATAALFMMDERGHCTYMNAAAEAMTGFTVAEIRDMPLHDAIHHRRPDGRPYPLSECPIDRALPEDFSVRAHEDVFIRKNGEFFPVVCAAGPIFRDGVPVGTVVEVRDVTEEQQAGRAIRESEERFRSLVEATAAIVWTTPASGALEGEQPNWQAFTGQSPDEYRGAGWIAAIHPDDRARTAAAWKYALETRGLYEVEHRLRRHDGEYRHMLARGIPVLEADGSIREWVGVHTDITQRKTLEDRQRFLVEASAVLASSLDYEVTLRAVAQLAVPSQADWCAIDLVGEDGSLERVEVAHSDPARRALALELHDRYPPDPDAPVGVHEVIRTGKPQLVPEIPDSIIEGAARDEEHRRILLELGLRSYMIVPLAARGRTLGAMTFVAAESGRRFGPDELLTAQETAVRAALAVENAMLFRQLEGALLEVTAARRRLHELFMQAPAFITVLHGPEHVFEMANTHYLNLVGNRELVGQSVAAALPEVVEQGFVALLDRVFSTGEPFVGNEIPVMLLRDGGRLEQRYVNFVYQPIRDGAGAVTGIFVHGVDVTDQVMARQQIEEKADELARLARALERSNRELDQFAYVASHDLKAPLRGIANLSQWIEEDLGDGVSEQTREQLELLRGRVHRMEGLINGILEYSRAGRTRDAVQDVDVRVLLDDVIDMLSPPEHIAFHVMDGMPVLQSERLPLEQVFMNLVGNAIKYAGGADARIEIDSRATENGWVEFRVADNGPGIAPEYHERVFGIFQTLHARDQVEGTGIGLSLVRKIVEARGGRVWIESEEGAGAAFRFLWPMDSTARQDPGITRFTESGT